MAIMLVNPGVDGLSEAVGVLREWQYDGARRSCRTSIDERGTELPMIALDVVAHMQPGGLT